MEDLPLNKIHILGWKSIKDTEVTLGKINILIGANGAGKSNFLSVFDLLRAIANNNLKLYIEKNGGANSCFYYGTKNTKVIKLKMDIGNAYISYEIHPGKDDTVILGWERYGRLNTPEENENYYNRQNNSNNVNTEELSESNETYRNQTSKLNKEIDELKKWFTEIIPYHLNDTSDNSPLKQVCDTDENRYLFPDGANIAAVLYKIKNESPQHYEKIKFTINLIFPEFKDFVFIKTDNYLKLRWQDENSIDYTLPLSAFSDGTLRFTALSVLLNQPKLPKLIIIDEPELGLHPQAITVLSEMIKLASSKSQILISTQSVDFINCFESENILIAENKKGETNITISNEKELQEWLKDYTLGEIWQKNLIGGNP
ncbi:MAG: AAA family ATPase [Methanocorpusculum sp.]|nr:AAA family ATPase [Methanocorpusculum sp.]